MKLFIAYFFTILFSIAAFQPTIQLFVDGKTDVYSFDKNFESTDSESKSNKNNVEDDSELSDFFISPSTIMIFPTLPYYQKFQTDFYSGAIRKITLPPPKI